MEVKSTSAFDETIASIAKLLHFGDLSGEQQGSDLWAVHDA